MLFGNLSMTGQESIREVRSILYFSKGHMLSIKSGVRGKVKGKGKGKSSPNVAAKKGVAKPPDAAKAPQQVEQEARERRNGYQMISTATYYRTERRRLGDFNKSGDWPRAKAEIDGATGMDGTPGVDDVPGADGTPWGESEPDR